MKLGIVGHGFVGTAVDHGFTRDVKKFIVDPKHNSTNTIPYRLVNYIHEKETERTGIVKQGNKQA